MLSVKFRPTDSSFVFEDVAKIYNQPYQNEDILSFQTDEVNVHLEKISLQEGIDVSIVKVISKEHVQIVRLNDKTGNIIPLTISNFSTYHRQRDISHKKNKNDSYELNWSNAREETYLDISPNEELRVLTFRIDIKALNQLEDQENSLLKKMILSNTDPFSFYHFVPEEMKRIIDKIFHLKGHIDWVKIKRKALCFDCLAEFLLLSQNKTPFKHDLTINKLQLQRVLDMKIYILKNITEKISIKDLENKFALSESSIHKDFKKVLKVSPYQFLKEERLAKAKDLLLNSTMSIGEIAYCLNFTSPSHFSYNFKKHFGILPKEYKNDFMI